MSPFPFHPELPPLENVIFQSFHYLIYIYMTVNIIILVFSYINSAVLYISFFFFKLNIVDLSVVILMGEEEIYL